MDARFPASVDALLQRMVQFDTVNSFVSGKPCAEAALTEYLEALAAQGSFETRRLPVPGHGDNLLVLYHANADRPWILFDSHLDTVGVEDMTIDPFGGEIHDGMLFGRGACDTKGTGAAMLWALREYAQSRPQPNNVAILYSVSEEIEMPGISRFCTHDLAEAGLGFRPRAVIVGEPTMLRPVTAHNGVARLVVETHGVAAHSSAPQLGKSAISMMARVIAAIESEYIARLDASHPLTGKAVCSINMIHGGTQVNMIPARCRIEIDRRLVPGEDADATVGRLRAVLEALKAGTSGGEAMDVTMQVVEARPGLDPRGSEAFLPVVQGVLARLGLPADEVGAPFCTHAADLAASGLATIVIGPGSPYPAHTKDEYIELDQLHKGVAFYKALMQAEIG